MASPVTLVGLDFGTTTSCIAVASAALDRNARTGRMELTRWEPLSQPEPVFTPFVAGALDEAEIGSYLATWLRGIDLHKVFGGGALVTGLAAQQANVNVIVRQTRQYLKDAIIAIGNDPCLESWLAYMSNSSELARQWPDRTLINLDIGGGTTNVAAGRGEEVFSTGCYFVGARHVEVEPGSYRIKRLSTYGRALLDHLRIAKSEGEILTDHEVLAVIDWYATLLEAVVSGAVDARLDAVTALHQQVAITIPRDKGDFAVTLSGGVGQLVYRHLQGEAWPATTAFGDLGIDLARRLAADPFWQKRLSAYVPTALGRATVFGLLRYSTQVSGATLHLDDAVSLPLNNLVIVGSIGPKTSDADADRLVDLAVRTAVGGCIRIQWEIGPAPPVRELATRVREALGRRARSADVPIVFLMRENLGKVFGQYLTDWGQQLHNIIVIDEVDHRDAQFAHVGRRSGPVIPVSLYGMN